MPKSKVSALVKLGTGVAVGREQKKWPGDFYKECKSHPATSCVFFLMSRSQ